MIEILEDKIKLLQKYVAVLVFGTVCLAIVSIYTSLTVFGTLVHLHNV